MIARFDELMADADDPGMTTFPDGYTFTSNQMVQEFEDGTRALEEYEISDIVESSYGYHIILRLPLDPEGKTLSQDSGTGDYMTLRADAANELFNAMLLDWIETSTVEWQGDFGTMDYNELFTVPEDGTADDAAAPETKSANVWMYVAIAALVVAVALAAVLLGKKKSAAPEGVETAETAEATAETTAVETTETAPEEAPAEAEKTEDPETKKEEDE